MQYNNPIPPDDTLSAVIGIVSLILAAVIIVMSIFDIPVRLS
jgi:hypothetical protein